jgi:hypothetical protein
MPSDAPSSTPLQCPRCGGGWRAGATRCWLCGAEVQPVAADSAATPPAAGQAGPAERLGTFSLASLMMFVALTAVVLGVSTIALGIGIPLGVVLLVVWLRTAAVLRYRHGHGRSTSQVKKLHLFLESFGVTLALIAVTCVVAIAALDAGFFVCLGTVGEIKDGSERTYIAMAVWCGVVLAIAIPAFWWIGKWIARVIRRRWRRDIGESDVGKKGSSWNKRD